jgi:hypothetical protein
MKYSFRCICLVVLMLFVSVSCTSLMPKDKFDPVKISSIKSVAVVSFTVPTVVGTKGSGLMNDLNALIDLTVAVVSDSNGQQIANGATASFIETMSASGHWHILSVKKVSTNAEIKSLTANTENNYVMVSMDGTPAVRLRMDGKPSEYATQSAKALGVDGVMMLAADDMSYFLDEGEKAIGTGAAKLSYTGVFKLYDKNGNSRWETEIIARSDDTVLMVAGSVTISEAYKLGKSLGHALATEVLSRYKKDFNK